MVDQQHHYKGNTMAKYLVEGHVKFSMEVEADSEDEAIETAEENFAIDVQVTEDSLPSFDVANLVEGADEDEEEDKPIRTKRAASFDDEDDD
jgi:hypothetical protein